MFLMQKHMCVFFFLRKNYQARSASINAAGIQSASQRLYQAAGLYQQLCCSIKAKPLSSRISS